MWSTLALATALTLAPHAGGDLKLTNDRATYGYLGPTRTDTKLLPGDIYYIAFDIENLDVGDDGQVLYSMGMDLLNSKGNKEFSQEPRDLKASNDLGGTSMPGYAATEIGTDTAPGEYTLKVTVTDRKSKKNATLTRKFEVLPKGFGLVRSGLTYFGQAPIPAPPLAVVGQGIVANTQIVGFDRDKDNKDQPNIGIEMAIRDESGKPTLGKPASDQVNMVPENLLKNLTMIPISEVVQLNRPGKFTITLRVTDKVSKKTAEVSFPIQVVDLKGGEK
jgi:hypothetical protein